MLHQLTSRREGHLTSCLIPEPLRQQAPNSMDLWSRRQSISAEDKPQLSMPLEMIGPATTPTGPGDESSADRADGGTSTFQRHSAKTLLSEPGQTSGSRGSAARHQHPGNSHPRGDAELAAGEPSKPNPPFPHGEREPSTSFIIEAWTERESRQGDLANASVMRPGPQEQTTAHRKTHED